MFRTTSRIIKTVIQQSVRLKHNCHSVAMRTFSLVVVSGPSGSGKSTLLQKLLTDHKDCFAFSVSHTTRKPRAGEAHGKDYYFVTRTEMENAIANGEFIEYAEFSGNLYGTSKKAVMEISTSGKICVLDVEVQGVQNVKKTDMSALYVFIKPPDLQALEERLKKRGTETEESLKMRLKTAEEAFAYASKIGSYDLVIENKDLDKAYDELKTALIKVASDVRKRSTEINTGQ